MPLTSIADRVLAKLPALSQAERRVAQVFQESREEVLFASAVALAQKAGTSDATVVRTVRALGYAGLEELRRELAKELKAKLSHMDRLAATLDEVVGDPDSVLGRTVAHHVEALTRLTRDVAPSTFQSAVDLVERSTRVVTFGVGPSSAVADYLVTQLLRFGVEAWSCTRTGLLCADDLNRLRPGDGLVVFAYGRGYAELTALLTEAERLGLERILITDDLDPGVRDRFDLVLPVARGRADMLSMHTATLGLVEALLVGVAAKRPDLTMASLRQLNRLRAGLVDGPTSITTVGARGASERRSVRRGKDT